ncbi:MAG: YicC family protein [Marinibacterium sp.]|nr:YicC family protein [Marinibacterium sp.]
MIRSMTGFASAQGQGASADWTAELRSVNGKGLDLRLRLPDGLAHLDRGVRALLSKNVARGSVTLSLRLQARDSAAGPVLNHDALAAALDAIAGIEAEAQTRGLTPAPWSAVDLLALRGVYDSAAPAPEADDSADAALMAGIAALIGDFNAMRLREGAALDAVLRAQLGEIAQLTEQASDLALQRRDDMQAALRSNLARVLDNADGADPDRVAQELALIAVKSDVTEELDRLRAHVDAATALLDGAGPVGRKLDFLMQEFNREANTLCSKAQSKDLTSVGLALKVVIDQMREQVQNVE